jgi:hypothetical protein
LPHSHTDDSNISDVENARALYNYRALDMSVAVEFLADGQDLIGEMTTYCEVIHILPYGRNQEGTKV